MSDPSSTGKGRRPPSLFKMSLAALGVVYGDVGTSPLYALRECFHGPHGLSFEPARVLGVLSLMFWALTIIITFKYLVYVMRADNRGEGGVLALMALATRSSPKRARALVMLGLVGAALLYGDGIITPAISVLSAVEGLEIAAPGLEPYVVPLTICILIGLFSVQHRGTAGIGAVFGPITLLWFLTLSALGLPWIIRNPEVLAAINPYLGAQFLIHEGYAGFLILGSVFLVVTGGEALYADMGHFGRKPIKLTWFVLVMPALLINYFGQGAFLLSHPKAVSNPFFRMAPDWALYPLIALSTCATIIASQAMISGAFSITRQATMLGFWPRVQVDHTSADEIGQVYVPSINWALMIGTVLLVLGFRDSSSLAAAYGIAVTATMLITTLLAYVVARDQWGWSRQVAGGLTVVLVLVDLSFFSANATKFADGGWFPIAVAAVMLTLMTTWRRGRERLRELLFQRLIPIEDFFELMHVERISRVPGTAVYMVTYTEVAPNTLLLNALHHRAVHENVVLLTVKIEETPRVEDHERVQVEELGHGFTRVVAHFGFMEQPNVPEILMREDTPTPAIDYTTFFLGRETVLAVRGPGMLRTQKMLFSFMTRNAQQAQGFFAIPPDRVIEVGAQFEL